MPAFHRFDISATLYGKKWDEKPPKKNGKKRWKYESNWNFSIYNAYMRKNAFTINFRENNSLLSIEIRTTPSVFNNL